MSRHFLFCFMDRWVAVNYDIKEKDDKGIITIKDAVGRPVSSVPIANELGQMVVDNAAFWRWPLFSGIQQRRKFVHLEELVVQ